MNLTKWTSKLEIMDSNINEYDEIRRKSFYITVTSQSKEKADEIVYDFICYMEQGLEAYDSQCVDVDYLNNGKVSVGRSFSIECDHGEGNDLIKDVKEMYKEAKQALQY